MTTITESDLKDLKDFLTSQFSKLEARFDKLEAQNQKLEITVAKIETKVDGIDKRVDDLNSRLNTFSLGFLWIVGTLVIGILGIGTKVVFFPNP